MRCGLSYAFLELGEDTQKVTQLVVIAVNSNESTLTFVEFLFWFVCLFAGMKRTEKNLLLYLL